MKWCRFERNGHASFGLIEGDQIVAVDGTPFGEHQRTTEMVPLAATKLLVPCMPSTFFCAGINYAQHVKLMAEKRGVAPAYPERPEIGYRANNALIAHGENIVKPADSGPNFQYEGELVAVFGRPARNVSKEEALDCVLGWTIGNDVSERDWQASDRTMWRSKNADTFKPMGPWIVTGLDPADMHTTIRINGEVTDSFATNCMIFDAATYISEVSKYCTISPGDVMWLGTDLIPRNIKVGDTVDIEISGIGTLSNSVVAERA